MDEEKPHQYYTTNAWGKSRNKSLSSTLQPGTHNRIISTQAPDRFSGHPISSLSANLVNIQNQDLYNTIVNRQRELKDREIYLDKFASNTPMVKTSKNADIVKAERSINDLKRAFSGHSKKLQQLSQSDILRLVRN